ncbi:MAG: PHP domain-containing protein [Clostridiales bacterium]|nr:PHP domain-containing protein [Clostridiales bacterium]
MIDLLKKNGKFYKANLHAHTTFSDGKMSPLEMKNLYKKNGYSIMAITDHSKFIYHKDLDDKDFLNIAGFEADFNFYNPDGTTTKRKTCHVNFFSKNPETAEVLPQNKTYDINIINNYIRDMAEKGWVAMLNHPAWSQQGMEEVNTIKGFLGMEIYNHGCNVIYNNGFTHDWFRSYISSGNKIYAFATDDVHCGVQANGEPNKGDNDSCGGYINVSMPSLTYENFFDAIENGRFYPSTGVEIKDLYIDEEKDELVISCSPVSTVIIKGNTCSSFKVPRIHTDENEITNFVVSMEHIRKQYTYFWVELKTKEGKIAHSQPYFLK